MSMAIVLGPSTNGLFDKRSSQIARENGVSIEITQYQTNEIICSGIDLVWMWAVQTEGV